MDLYEKLKNDAKNYLDTIKPIRDYNKECKGKSRFVMYDINTILNELLTLIEQTNTKREKRLQRFRFLLDICKKTNSSCLINQSLINRFNNATKNKSNKNIFSFSKPKQIFKEEKSLFLLQEELEYDIDNLDINNDMDNLYNNNDFDNLYNNNNNNNKNNKIKKHDKNLFYYPGEIQDFNDHCKSILNLDGTVYDIFTYVIIIAFTKLINSYSKPSLRHPILKILIDSAQIAFKGGASIGKFILIHNTMLWNQLSDEEKNFALSNFINGGDNDTTIIFDKVKLKQYTNNIDLINKYIYEFIVELSSELQKVVENYNIVDIINKNINNVNNSKFTYADTEFSFSNRTADSYSIIEDPNDIDYLIYQKFFEDSIPHQLYNTLGYVEFSSYNGDFKFYLTRIKCGFLTQHNIPYDKIKANCYAECLDVSIECIDSAQFLPNVCYIDIDLQKNDFYFN